MRVVVVQAIFESAECALALYGSGQDAAGSQIADADGEVGHVLVPHVGRQRLDREQIQLVEVDRGLTVDPAVLGPELGNLRVPLLDYLPEWSLAMRSGERSPRTVASYTAGVHSLARWLEANDGADLTDVDPGQMPAAAAVRVVPQMPVALEPLGEDLVGVPRG
jgi:hypothetical protein